MPAETKYPTERELLEELLKRKQATESLLPFCSYTYPRYEKADHLKALIERLEAVERGDIDRLMVFMPPRHGKSETASIRFPAWYLGRHPQDTIIGASHTDSLAYTFSYAIRGVITGDRYQKLWPCELDQAQVTRWKKALCGLFSFKQLL